MSMSYRILSTTPLGEGAMAVSYIAEDENGEKVLIKRFKTPIHHKDENQWNREVDLLQALQHPQIPRYVAHYIEKVEGRRLPHLVMEFIKGTSLASHLQSHRVTQIQSLEWVQQLLSILCYLQALSPPVIHRDIKPSNILLRPDGQVVLIDFGLAVDDIHRTMGHSLGVGTLGYQSPEQISGDPTIRSDLYSVGAFAVELLTGLSPSSLLDGMRLRWEEKCLGLPMSIQNWLDQMLAYDGEDRFPHAQAALQAFPSIKKKVPIIKAAIRSPQTEASNAFLQRLEAKKEERRRKEAEERQAALEEAEAQRLDAERKARERIITQRRNEEESKRKAKAEQRWLEESQLLVEEIALSWDHGIAALNAQSIEVEDLLSSFRDEYFPRQTVKVSGLSRRVSHPLLGFVQSYQPGKMVLSSLEYCQYIITEKYPLVVKEKDLQDLVEEQRLLKLRLQEVEQEQADLGFFDFFQSNALESKQSDLEAQYASLKEEYQRLCKEKKEHLLEAYWRPFYDTTFSEEELKKEVERLQLEQERKERIKREQEHHKHILQAMESMLVCIPSGCFVMGVLLDDHRAEPREGPRHEVRISDSFWMSKYLVTQQLYKAVTGTNPSQFKGNELPMEQVSWADAVLFCNLLSEKKGLEKVYQFPANFQFGMNDDLCDALSQKVKVKWSANGYRLPTEAEWEYAARGGHEHKYAGSDHLDKVGWYDGNSEKKTHPVGQKLANGYGLYDMSGNVWEWCWDTWCRKYEDCVVVDPQGAWNGSSEFRVTRGGSWEDSARFARASFRGNLRASYCYNRLGFRFLRKAESD